MQFITPGPDPRFFGNHREPAGGKLRFAVGEPNGFHSATCMVFGDKKKDEIYVGMRSQAQLLKLSLHVSGQWRWAYTHEAAKAAGDTSNRVLAAFPRPQSKARGWVLAASIIIPASRIGPKLAEKSLKPSDHMTWWPPPPMGNALGFEVLAPDPGAPESRFFVPDIVGEVGHLALPSGRRAIVLVRELLRPEVSIVESMVLPGMNDAWAAMADDPIVENDAFAFYLAPDGHPVLVDMGRWS